MHFGGGRFVHGQELRLHFGWSLSSNPLHRRRRNNDGFVRGSQAAALVRIVGSLYVTILDRLGRLFVYDADLCNGIVRACCACLDDGKVLHAHPHALKQDHTYLGAIARTDNRGRRFNLMYNTTLNGLNVCFNGISFIDSNNGWYVCLCA
jgi:hypothetical protein